MPLRSQETAYGVHILCSLRRRFCELLEAIHWLTAVAPGQQRWQELEEAFLQIQALMREIEESEKSIEDCSEVEALSIRTVAGMWPLMETVLARFMGQKSHFDRPSQAFRSVGYLARALNPALGLHEDVDAFLNEMEEARKLLAEREAFPKGKLPARFFGR
jgi:hypothetical protein